MKSVVDVRKAIEGGVELLWHTDVLQFYEDVLENLQIPEWKRIALFLPCAAQKPYSLSRTHRRVINVINNIVNGGINPIHEIIVGEPLGVVPREWEEKYPAAHYNMILDTWFPLNILHQRRKENIPDDIIEIRETQGITNQKRRNTRTVIDELSKRVAEFLKKTRENYSFKLAYLRGTHRKILERASKLSNVPIHFVIDKKLRSAVIQEKGTFYWIMNGLRSPISLKKLEKDLSRVLDNL